MCIYFPSFWLAFGHRWDRIGFLQLPSAAVPPSSYSLDNLQVTEATEQCVVTRSLRALFEGGAAEIAIRVLLLDGDWSDETRGNAVIAALRRAGELGTSSSSSSSTTTSTNTAKGTSGGGATASASSAAAPRPQWLCCGSARPAASSAASISSHHSSVSAAGGVGGGEREVPTTAQQIRDDEMARRADTVLSGWYRFVPALMRVPYAQCMNELKPMFKFIRTQLAVSRTHTPTERRGRV
jgi:hypothetical protein